VKSSIAPPPCAPAVRGRLAFRHRIASALAISLIGFACIPALAQQGSAPYTAQTPEMSDALAAGTALAQARRMREDGDAAGALRTIEMALERLPRDVALRFTRAVMQADLGQIDAALAGFTALTREYPELPEPYNNLATLHATRGDLDRALQALAEAVRAMPSYALAWENLGDVHLRLAERAWREASALDKASEAQAKLRLARELIERLTSRPDGTARPASP